jgi:hypothetical protein
VVGVDLERVAILDDRLGPLLRLLVLIAPAHELAELVLVTLTGDETDAEQAHHEQRKNPETEGESH